MASATYLVSRPKMLALDGLRRPIATGTMSASAIHPAKITQARAALRRRKTLVTATRAATAPATGTRTCGGYAKANDPPSTGIQCHGPPTDPGTMVSLISSHEKLRAVVAETGTLGLVADVRSAIASTTP